MGIAVPHRPRLRARPALVALLSAAMLGLAANPAPAAASTTIGSPMPSNGSGAAQAGCSPLCTLIPLSISTGEPVQSPIDGVIVRWGASSSDSPKGTSTVRLRVLRAVAPGQFVGRGTGPVEHTTGGFVNDFFVVRPGMPIAAGDYMGVDTVRDDGTDNASTMRLQAGSETSVFYAPLPDGGPAQTGTPLPDIELYAQATIEPDVDGDLYGDETQDECSAEPDNHGPCSMFTLGKPKLNRHRGTAKAPVTVPGAGEVSLAGKGVARQNVAAAGAGTVKVKVKPKGRAKRKLERRGRARVRVKVAFTPTGGTARTQSERIKLRMERG